MNSIAHWLGETTYDDKHTPRDHFVTAVLTLGEGYHNFHHQFPMDYRNAVKWYQYDPTKWFIALCAYLGLASHLHIFPENEIRKGELSMSLKHLKRRQDSLSWPKRSNELPVIDWKTCEFRSIPISSIYADFNFILLHLIGAQSKKNLVFNLFFLFRGLFMMCRSLWTNTPAGERYW